MSNNKTFTIVPETEEIVGMELSTYEEGVGIQLMGEGCDNACISIYWNEIDLVVDALLEAKKEHDASVSNGIGKAQ